MLNFLFQNSPLVFLSQSVWRDEAYSILIAQKPLATYFQLSFEPPLYYIFLHFWIKVFGTSEIAVRCLSLLGFFVATFFIIKWAGKLFRTQWLSWYLPLIFFFNPMLLYYAFEARAYGWYIAFTVLSCYFYFEKKWIWYIISTILGLYTHTFMVFVPIIQCIHHILIHKNMHSFRGKLFFIDPFIRSLCLIIALYIPWILNVIKNVPKLSQSWYFPIDAQLFKSVLGNIFLGYEGTPWFLWTFMEGISILLLAISLISFVTNPDKKRTGFFLLLMYLPLTVVLLASLIKPLFVMRYMIPSTIAQILLVTFMLDALKSPLFQKTLSACILVFIIGFNIWFTPYHLKPPLRSTLIQVNSQQQKNDVILVDDARVLYETMYYNTSESPVYWYNPDGVSFPWYIGDYIVKPTQIVRELPPYPARGFLIHMDGTYEITYNSPMTSTVQKIIPKKK